jgi:hypothetical protein
MEKARRGTFMPGKGVSKTPNYMKFMLLDYEAEMAIEIAELKDRNPCLPEHERTEKEQSDIFPRWNFISAIIYFSPASEWNRAARVSLDLELASEIVKVHQLHAEEQKLPHDFASSVCPGEMWKYRVNGNEARIEFSKKIDWSQTSMIRSHSPQLPITHIDQLKP